MDLADFYRPQLQDATRRLFLSPEERNLYEHHLKNLWGPTGVDNPNGSRSTLYQMSTDVGGRTFNMPTVYDGQILHPDAAFERGAAGGLERWPSYPTQGAAEARYGQMHDQMENDRGADSDIRRLSFLPTIGDLYR